MRLAWSLDGYPPGDGVIREGVGGARKEQRMLVLTRKTNQSIMIGDDIEVSVLAVSRDKIRIGIEAPREIPVFRKEVYESVHENRAIEDAAKTDGAGDASA
jgi:carbon storage regulator